ncbi:MAG: HAD-IIA family hydrolase [Acidimicrobiia bacterium]
MTTSLSRGTVVLDLDGVVYLDAEGIPGAGPALESLATAGWELLYATNNSSKTSDMVAMHIKDRTGFPASAAAAVTSGMAAGQYISERHSSALVVGTAALEETIASYGISVVDTTDPDVVVVGLDRDISYDTIDRASRAIRGGAEFVATNVDSTYPTPTGLAPGAGSIVAAIAAAAGTDPVSCGKPSQMMISLLAERISGDTVWVVGDRPETDLALAIQGGWRSILVLTGVAADARDVPPELTPNHVAQSIADVPALLAKHGG